ncbi:flavodoxin domain-containing protein [Bacillus sp. S13(2024)]|uniref:flavodoxin domain-containing protein n=1 Tax=Bacillus sp. S13(2024) TaxID=3162885 RepID=UPI003D22B0B5
MTSRAIFYFSLTGNTKAILQDTNGFDVYDITKTENIDFSKYSTVILGLSTYGRGSAHENTWGFLKKFVRITGKKIGLFGSGNSIYPDFCGALDIIEDAIKDRNEILFKYKFEAYPTLKVKDEFKRFIARCMR